jgi:hypothetical protein
LSSSFKDSVNSLSFPKYERLAEKHRRKSIGGKASAEKHRQKSIARKASPEKHRQKSIARKASAEKASAEKTPL